ncbi:MAG: thiamine phosphate synthase [Actinomycetota bacterium]|nr:thiamine phosphate synthase [Actinomycetota bacterium]
MTSPQSTIHTRLKHSTLYFIASIGRGSSDLDTLLASTLEAGVDIIQLRDKQAETTDLLRAAETFRKRASEFSALFIVNDRVDVAVASGADGVHLGQDDLPLASARRIGGQQMIIGLSTHSQSQIDESSDSEADHIAVGPVYETPTKAGRPAVGTQLVSYAAGSSPRLFFAIGGIDIETLPAVIAAGATRVAVVRAIEQADDPAATVRKMKAMLG